MVMDIVRGEHRDAAMAMLGVVPREERSAEGDGRGDVVEAPREAWVILQGFELPLFEPPAVEALFQSSRGLPRQINRIAHYALSAAALDNARTVNAEHLQHALDELRP